MSLECQTNGTILSLFFPHIKRKYTMNVKTEELFPRVRHKEIDEVCLYFYPLKEWVIFKMIIRLASLPFLQDFCYLPMHFIFIIS